MRSWLLKPSLENRVFLACALILSGLMSLLAGCGAKPSAAAQNLPADKAASSPAASAPHGTEVATLACGCFWCSEAIFQELKGVNKVEPGYAGGHTTNPTYEDVCTGMTGHAESVQVVFDPKVLSYHDLLVIFFTTHDPTTLDRQGPDVGTQYRSAIFYHSSQQKATAKQVIAEMNRKHLWPGPIVTEVVPFTNFYPAEAYHRNYFLQNPTQFYCQAVIAPKVAKFREEFRDRLK